jgi:hypothetical protein
MPDRRQDARIPWDQPVRLTALGCASTPPRPLASRSQAGRTLEVSRGGLRLWCGESIPPGTPVKAEVGTTLLLGEVVRAEPAPQGGFCLALALSQVLFPSPELDNLRRALLGSPADVALTGARS